MNRRSKVSSVQSDLWKYIMRDAWERLPKKGGNMEDCIFCKLANGEIPTDMVYEDDRIACFRDADPQAPVHVLMVPRKSIFRHLMTLRRKTVICWVI